MISAAAIPPSSEICAFQSSTGTRRSSSMRYTTGEIWSWHDRLLGHLQLNPSAGDLELLAQLADLAAAASARSPVSPA